MTPPVPASGPPIAPLIWLGLLTVATMAGPVVIVLTIHGGPRPEWPPDRPIEWWVFATVVLSVVILLTGCLTSGLWARAKTTSRGD